MEYKRLTKSYKGAPLHTDMEVTDGDEIYERLAELEDKIEQGTMIELPCVLKPYYLCGEWRCKIMIGFDKNSVPIMEYFHGKEKETVVSKAEKRLKELE